jgi:Fic family protein
VISQSQSSQSIQNFSVRDFIAQSNLIDTQYNKAGDLLPGDAPGTPMYEAHLRALERYPEFASRRQFSARIIRAIHRELTRGIDVFEDRGLSGEYRWSNVSIKNEALPSPKKIPTLINKLLIPAIRAGFDAQPKTREEALRHAWFCHDLYECIHPFIDGNGRSGRLLLNLILHKHNQEGVTVWYDRRQDYYNDIRCFRRELFPKLEPDTSTRRSATQWRQLFAQHETNKELDQRRRADDAALDLGTYYLPPIPKEGPSEGTPTASVA